MNYEKILFASSVAVTSGLLTYIAIDGIIAYIINRNKNKPCDCKPIVRDNRGFCWFADENGNCDTCIHYCEYKFGEKLNREIIFS